MTLVDTLITFVIDRNEIENSVTDLNCNVIATYNECCKACYENLVDEAIVLKINSVVDYLHDELHTGHWSTVPLSVKKGFSASSFIKAIISIKQDISTETMSNALKYLDMGILLGAPLENNPDLLTKSAKFISEELNKTKPNVVCRDSKLSKRKLCKMHTKYNDVNATEIDEKSLPPLELFLNNYLRPEKPLKIQDSMSHWPACKKWINVEYLLNVAGDRTVPVEIGSQYSDENWSQKLMTMKEFIEKYFLESSDDIGYLAQHNLLDQIPELMNDVCVPDYCCMTRNLSTLDCSPEINAWFGPKGTVSSLHFDPKDNILAQVFGTKQVIMFSPSDSNCLYPHDSPLLSNTAQVDPLCPDLVNYPKFKDAVMYKCLLEPGEMLYIPPKWWHHITALEKSFSVNFWWS